MSKKKRKELRIATIWGLSQKLQIVFFCTIYACVSSFSIFIVCVFFVLFFCFFFLTYQGVNELQKRLQVHGGRNVFFVIWSFWFDWLFCSFHMGKCNLICVEIWFRLFGFWFSTQHEGIEPQQQSRTVHN